MLAALLPDHEAEPPAKWQQRKSAQTRQRLVEAGIECLVRHGYAGLTTAAVAERCAVSRGAMHHHFASRMELVAAVVDHVFYQRMRAFLEDYFSSVIDRGDVPFIEVACVAHWRSVQSREYAAYLELAAAARTDSELAALFVPASCRYDKVWTREMIEAFPHWEEHWDALKLANDFAAAIHMGMLLHAPVFDGGERMQRLHGLIAQVVQQIHAGALVKTGTPA